MINQSSLKQNFKPELAPIFDQTNLGRINTKVNPERWGEVEEAFKKGNYKYVIIGILHYVDSGLVSMRGNSEKTEFLIPHGSIMVRLKIDRGELKVTAPFLQIPAADNLPLLRRVTEINFKQLGLPEIILKDNKLEFFFQCPLELCHPDKIYDALFEICLYADEYDDIFIEEFGAQRLHKPVIKKFPARDVETAWNRFLYYLEEAVLYFQLFESSRQYDNCLFSLSIALMKIYYYLAPQGVLKTDFEKHIDYLKNRDIPVRDRIQKGRAFLDTLQDISRDKVAENLYVSETFIPLKRYLGPDILNSILEGCYNNAQNALSANNYINVVLILLDFFFSLFYYYTCPIYLIENISNALMRASKKPWADAADTLWQMLVRLINAG